VRPSGRRPGADVDRSAQVSLFLLEQDGRPVGLDSGRQVVAEDGDELLVRGRPGEMRPDGLVKGGPEREGDRSERRLEVLDVLERVLLRALKEGLDARDAQVGDRAQVGE
jgi:hypothetical protein